MALQQPAAGLLARLARSAAGALYANGGAGQQALRHASNSAAPRQAAQAQPAEEPQSEQGTQQRWAAELGVVRTDWT